MGNVIEYIDEAPNRAIVYLLMMAVLTLSSVVVYLFKDKQKQEVATFDLNQRRHISGITNRPKPGRSASSTFKTISVLR